MRKGYAGNGQVGSSTYKDYGAQVSAKIENANVLDGIVYGLAKRFNVPSSGVVDIVFDPTAYTGSDITMLPIKFKAYGAGPINIDVYVDTDSSDDGTLVYAVNRDLRLGSMSEMIMRIGPTINTIGTLLPNDYVILSDGVSANSSIGGEAGDDLILVIDITKKYHLRLTNTEANIAYAHIAASWFEVE